MNDGIPENGAPVGVLGTIAGIIGAIQATEAIKYITGINGLLIGKLLQFDALTMESKIIGFAQSATCRCRH